MDSVAPCFIDPEGFVEHAVLSLRANDELVVLCADAEIFSQGNFGTGGIMQRIAAVQRSDLDVSCAEGFRIGARRRL